MRTQRRIAILVNVDSTSEFSTIGYVGEHYLGVLRYLRDRTDWVPVCFGLPLTTPQSLPMVERLRRENIAGVLFEGQHPDVVEACRTTGIPAVAMNRFHCEPWLFTVDHDDWAIGRLAARYFLRRGFRSLAFCGPHHRRKADDAWIRDHHRAVWARRRMEGFTQTAQEAGATCSVFYNPDDLAPGESDALRQERFSQSLCEWVRSLTPPVAIFGCSDIWGMDCLRACEEEGLRVPHDVAVMGADNNAFRCEVCHPPLSSVDRNMFQVGHEAAELLARYLTTGSWGTRPRPVPPAGVVERLSTETLAVPDLKLAAALRFVRAHYREPISASDVARAVGVSDSWLRRAFQHDLRFSLVSEIRRLRVAKACELLTSADLPLKTIAESVGFHSETYLCHVFAEDMGVSPRVWSGRSGRARGRAGGGSGA